MPHRGNPVDNNVLSMDGSSCELLGDDDLLRTCSDHVVHMGAT